MSFSKPGFSHSGVPCRSVRSTVAEVASMPIPTMSDASTPAVPTAAGTDRRSTST